MAGFTKRTLAHSSAMPSARDAGICDCRAAGLSRQALPTLTIRACRADRQ